MDGRFLHNPKAALYMRLYIWHVMGQILHQSQEMLHVVKRPGTSPFTDALHFITIRVYSSVIYYMTEAFQSL